MESDGLHIHCVLRVDGKAISPAQNKRLIKISNNSKSILPGSETFTENTKRLLSSAVPFGKDYDRLLAYEPVKDVGTT